MAQNFLTSINLNSNELQNGVIQNLPIGSEPTGIAGQIYYNTTSSTLKYCTAPSTWVTVGTSSSSVTSVGVSQPAAGFTISGATINAGNPSGTFTFALSDDLAAVEGLSTNGIVARTATNTWATRTITGTASRISISNGDGVSGAPTIDIHSSYVGQTSITTLGTVATGTLSTGAVLGGVTMTLGSDANYDTYYRSAGGVLTRLANGTTGQFLGANTGAAPSWQTVTSGITSLTGDVTGTGPGATATTIAANAVTLAKMATIATGHVIGNMSGSTATPLAVDASVQPTVSSILVRGPYSESYSTNYISSGSTTATAAGTTTLGASSNHYQEFTGTTTQTVVLPTTAVAVGQSYTILNNSTGVLTIQTSTAADLYKQLPGTVVTYIPNRATPTAVAHWNFKESGHNTATKFTIANNGADGRNKVDFDLSGGGNFASTLQFTHSGNRLIKFPDINTELIGNDTTHTLTNKTIDANGTGNVISNLEVADFAGSAIVTAAEGIASNNNDTTLPTSAAVKAYTDALIGANDAMVYKGAQNCSANPNYPAATNAGETWKISVAGKIGGASGPNVSVGDMIIATADGLSTGDHATVGSSWNIIQYNLESASTTVQGIVELADSTEAEARSSGILAVTPLSLVNFPVKKTFTCAAHSGNISTTVCTHNYGHRDVIVQIRKTGSPYDLVYGDVAYTSTTSLTVILNGTISAGDYTIITLG